MKAVIPDARSRVRLQRSAMPRTFERYTLRADGYVGGPVQRPGFPPLTAPGHRPARGIFVAGDHVFPGQGTVGVALSGINAYPDACDTLGVRALL
ncbi:MAG: hypothetical protein U5Q44_03140 [Dehalococcoidia bacterium]|nr:hypothetical protein [Dehalococcoidia bacterium]